MEEKILSLIKEPLENIGVKVYSISLEKEDGVDTLFIRIDSEGVVDTDLCVKCAEIINPIMDNADLSGLENYVLDVCSKGVTDNE